MTGDLVTELVRLVDAYHWRWVTVHGDHGRDCELCAGLHLRHAWALKTLEHEPDNDGDLEVAV